MATEVVLPQWGMNMREGTLVRWLKREGDPIQEGEPFAEIETEKIQTSFESPVSGVVAHIMVTEGATVPVGALLVVIAGPGETVPRPAPRPSAAAPAALAASSAMPAPATVGPGPQVVPAARRLAKEHDIDLRLVPGTGSSGRITEADVRRAIDALTRPVARTVPLTGTRRAIADRMLQSVQTMAQVTLHTEVDVTALVQLRHELVSRWRAHRLRPLDLDMVIKATARALKEHPRLNAILVEDHLHLLDEVNVGVATALADGLVVTIVKRASDKSLLEIAQEMRALADKARRRALSRDDVADGTFTVTTLASYEIDGFTPIINPPQVAILGVGRIVEKPAVHQGGIAVRSVMSLSLTFDHRALDGVPAAEFLRTTGRYLADPRWMAG